MGEITAIAEKFCHGVCLECGWLVIIRVMFWNEIGGKERADLKETKELKELNVAIGGRIRTYRESLGKSREAFSEMVGLSPQFLAEAEKGTKGLSAESIYKICQNGGMSADYLVLGKINSQDMKTPFDSVLREMPGEYSARLAEVLKAMNDMILEAKNK